MAYTEKHCSVCDAVSWDNLSNSAYKQEHTIHTKKGDVKAQCDTNGRVVKMDSFGHEITD
jgi:hypothetical protein